MSEFQRGERYIVIKLANLTSRQHEKLPSMLDSFASACVNSVVVESDWPEFEPVWRMIEARVTGVVPEVMRWPLKGVLPGVEGISKAVLKPVVVLASDYDALAAQRDEGLAREAELRAVYESQNKDYIQSARIAHGAKDYEPSMMMPLANTVAALQQRLAEAEKDAARYRWLRDRPLDGSEPFWIAVSSDDVYQTRCWALGGSSPDTCDQAIDNAMSSAGPADQEQQS